MAAASANWQRPGYKQTDKDPVVCLSWSDAVSYVNWLAAKTGKPYRLPTEAEVEYATRAGTTTSRYWGDSQEEQCKWLNGADATLVAAFPGGGYSDEIDYANGHVVECSDGFIQTSPVGSFPPNPWGFYDILGNTFSWTADCWNSDYVGAPTDGSAWTTGLCTQHVIRGGSWYFHPGAPHSTFRHPSGGGSRQEFTGLRLARSLP